MFEPAPEGRSTANGLINPFWWRWGGLAAAAILAVFLVIFLPMVPWVEGRNVFRLSHALASAPYLVGGLVFTIRALHFGSLETRVFWWWWRAAAVAGILATFFVATGALADSQALLGLGMVCLAVCTPCWVSAVWMMARAHAGRWSLSVDLVDTATALLVLVAPSALLLVGPVRNADHPAYTVPFILLAVSLPGIAYLSLLQLSRIRQGEQSAHVIGLTLTVSALANSVMQLTYIAGRTDIPLRALLTVHTVNMALLFLLPLWAHHRLGKEASESVVRRHVNLVPYVAAVVLPLTALYVLLRGGEGWEVAVLVAVLVVVVVLNAVRQAVLAREARRLSADVARMAEQRRHLLAGLLHGVERDRQRTVTELHAQALGSVAVLGAVAQTAQSSLPAATASQVKEAIGRVQRDLSHRADELRQLMVAMRGPAPGAPEAMGEPASEDTLTALILAFEAELYQGRPVPEIDVDVAPTLRLDWSTATIAYRIAQEALLDVASDESVTRVRIALVPAGAGVTLQVEDDGTGPRTDQAASMRRSEMELFAYLAQGDMQVRSREGGGRIVSCRLGPGAAGGTEPSRTVDRPLRRESEAVTPGPGAFGAPAAAPGSDGPEEATVADGSGSADGREASGDEDVGSPRRGHLSLVGGAGWGRYGSLRASRRRPDRPGRNDVPPQQPDHV